MAFRARWETAEKKSQGGRHEEMKSSLFARDCLNVKIARRKSLQENLLNKHSRRLQWKGSKRLILCFFSVRNQKANGLDTCVHNNTWSRRKKSAWEEEKKKKNENTLWMNEN